MDDRVRPLYLQRSREGNRADSPDDDNADGALWPEQDRNLILDASGRIVFCRPSTARLLGRLVSELIGRPVTEVFPELPLCSRTPGYNLAYARFHGASWAARAARRADGMHIRVAMLLRDLVLEHGRFIVVTVRPAGTAANDGEAAG